jgi:signal transduction histidine kinase
VRSDVLLAGTLAVVAAVELTTGYAFERTDEPGPLPLHFVIAVAAASALAWRRLLPLYVAPGVMLLYAVQPMLVALPNLYVPLVVHLIAVYSLAVYAASWRGIALASGVVAAFAVVLGGQEPSDPVGSAATGVVFTVIAVAVGAVVRRYRQRTNEMRQERDQAEAHARAVAIEARARIARELHDVVAHGMSIVVLQARGGRHMIAADPAQARTAFDAIEEVASECLDEMRRLLGILRGNGVTPAPLAPQPKLHELVALVEQAQASGAAVQLTISGEQRTLAPAIELSAYRIAQEALTNALKHAPGSRTEIHLRYDDDMLVIEVTDDGPGDEGRPAGHGLTGMRERAELFGGTLEVGPSKTGGFGVCARLPMTRMPA